MQNVETSVMEHKQYAGFLRWLVARIFTFTLSLLLSSCARVRIYNAGRDSSMEYKFGILGVKLEGTNKFQLLQYDGFRFFIAEGSFYFGYLSEKIAEVPPSCSIILWIETEEQLDSLELLLSKHPNVCSTSGSTVEARNETS